jgi:cell wall-associated NlpC family hydrolase
MTSFDKRITPARPDLAAAHLRGKVEASAYNEGRSYHVIAGSASLRREPRPDGPLDSEALMGEAVTVYEMMEGWAWGQLTRDGYVGYLPEWALAPGSLATTHVVTVARSFCYPGPSMKLPPLDWVSLGSAVNVVRTDGDFAVTAVGQYIWAAHLVPIADAAPDFVSVAEMLIGTPYLWGGKTSLGLDCSGLAQISLAAAGIAAPRDSDQQEATLGEKLRIGDDLAGLQRGDLVFWRGHVGIMRDATTLLHANGHHMLVASEALRGAVDRIAKRTQSAGTGAGLPTAFKRLL